MTIHGFHALDRHVDNRTIQRVFAFGRRHAHRQGRQILGMWLFLILVTSQFGYAQPRSFHFETALQQLTQASRALPQPALDSIADAIADLALRALDNGDRATALSAVVLFQLVGAADAHAPYAGAFDRLHLTFVNALDRSFRAATIASIATLPDRQRVLRFLEDLMVAPAGSANHGFAQAAIFAALQNCGDAGKALLARVDSAGSVDDPDMRRFLRYISPHGYTLPRLPNDGYAEARAARKADQEEVIVTALRYLRADLGADMVIAAHVTGWGRSADEVKKIAARVPLRVLDEFAYRRCSPETGVFYTGPEKFIIFHEPTISGDTAVINVYWTFTPSRKPAAHHAIMMSARLELTKAAGRWSVSNATRAIQEIPRECP